MFLLCGVVCTHAQSAIGTRGGGGKEQFSEFSGADPVFLLWNSGIKLSFLFVLSFFLPQVFTKYFYLLRYLISPRSFIELLTIPVVLLFILDVSLAG